MILLFVSLILGNVVTVGEPDVAKVVITKTKEIGYYLLSRTEPLTIEVDGPTWLRVYTRVLWNEDMQETERYKIIVERDAEDDRIVQLTTERSDVSKVFDREISKWRSFYINVPPDAHTYRFYIWKANSDSILLRFSHQSPQRWERLIPISYVKMLETIESEKIYYYYTGSITKPLTVKVEGPRKIKVVSRVVCDSTFIGENVYGIAIHEGDSLIKRLSYNTKRSETVEFRNDPRVVPSVPSITYLDIGEGEHIIKFQQESRVGEVAFAFYVRGSR